MVHTRMAKSEEKLQRLVNELEQSSYVTELKMITGKSKVIVSEFFGTPFLVGEK